MSGIEVRNASAEDLPAILDIYNEVTANSTASYSVEPSTLEERRAWFDARTREGFPVIVAVGEDGVVGFASFGQFRGAWAGYRYSVEHTVHVCKDQRGKGIGTRLVQELLLLAKDMGKHVMVGGIDAANHGSIRMHERLGFERAATLHEVGHKFGRWLDLVFMQRFLDEPGSHRED
ncbi:MAG: N-acetyltransferase [Dehalococcoidia bacterium]|nr:N-acetyltransferase [Dehalococcoidia bacterium]